MQHHVPPVPVAKAVAQAEAMVAPRLRASGLRFTWGPRDEELNVQAIPEKVQQIRLRVLSGSRQAHGRARRTARSHRGAAHGGWERDMEGERTVESTRNVGRVFTPGLPMTRRD